MTNISFNPTTDLKLQKIAKASPEQIFKAWTTPEHLKKFFAPHPWKTVDAKVDLRIGGEFSSTMQSPEGQQFPNTGCFLEIIPNQKLVFTDTLAPGFRPVEKPFFTAIITLEKHPEGTLYTAYALHKNAEDKKTHAEMGFEEGWGQVFKQLDEVALTIRG